MKRSMMTLTMVALSALLAISITACDSTSDSDSDLSTSYADQVKGTYEGDMQNPTAGHLTDYRIIVTKVSDTKIHIAPAEGVASQTFDADLEASTAMNGAITLKADDILETNGQYMEVNGTKKLTYTYHLGGDDDGSVEVFVGKRVTD